MPPEYSPLSPDTCYLPPDPSALAPTANPLGAGGGDAHPASDYSLRDGVAVIQKMEVAA